MADCVSLQAIKYVALGPWTLHTGLKRKPCILLKTTPLGEHVIKIGWETSWEELQYYEFEE